MIPLGVQGSIRIARNFPNRHHPDFQRVQVLNNVFGGFFGSRLMTNIREDKGYTYGIYSYLVNNRQESALMISTEAGKEVCEPAIEEVYKEMNLLREELIDDEELQMARNFAIGYGAGRSRRTFSCGRPLEEYPAERIGSKIISRKGSGS